MVPRYQIPSFAHEALSCPEDGIFCLPVLGSLLEEYQCVRKSTYALYKTFDNDQLLFSGKANGQDTSVIALGFMMIGHSIHHYRVIEERYFPLTDL